MSQFDDIYKLVLRNILENGVEQDDKRLFHKDQPQNKSKTKIISGVTIKTDLLKDGLPLLSLRKLSIKLFVAESIWFLTGKSTTDEFLKKYTKIWEAFKEDDDTVTSYGHRWRNHFNRDQLVGVLEMLKKDPTSRHGVLGTWDPSSDSLSNGRRRKNVPCNLTIVLNIVNGRLNMHSIWRSTDMILGFPNDVAGNALLAYIFAAYLGVEPGEYYHYITNAHIYDIHYGIARELVSRNNNQKQIKVKASPDWYTKGGLGDHNLTKHIINSIKDQYSPLDAIKGIKIVV